MDAHLRRALSVARYGDPVAYLPLAQSAWLDEAGHFGLLPANHARIVELAVFLMVGITGPLPLLAESGDSCDCLRAALLVQLLVGRN